MSRLFASGGQNIIVSASASVFPVNIEGWFPLGLTDLISLQSKGLFKSLQENNLKASNLQCSAFFMVQLSHPYMTIGKTIAYTIWICVGKVMSLLFNMLSRFAIAFLPRSKYLLISRLQSLTVCSDLEAQENKICHCFHSFLLFASKWWDYMPWS